MSCFFVLPIEFFIRFQALWFLPCLVVDFLVYKNWDTLRLSQIIWEQFDHFALLLRFVRWVRCFWALSLILYKWIGFPVWIMGTRTILSTVGAFGSVLLFADLLPDLSYFSYMHAVNPFLSAPEKSTISRLLEFCLCMSLLSVFLALSNSLHSNTLSYEL